MKYMEGGHIMADIDNNVETNTDSAVATNVETTPTDTSVESKPTEVTEPVKAEETLVPEVKPVKATGKNRTKADLQREIESLQKELNNMVDNTADFTEQLNSKDAEITSIRSEANNYKAEVEKLTAALNSVIEDKKNKLPENLKGLVPANQSAIETLNWLLKAEGNVKEETPAAPEVQIGRVIPIDRGQINANSEGEPLSPYEKMASAFTQLFAKNK